jgi:hypothetical protein
MLTKTLSFEQPILDIIAAMEWTELDGKIAGKLTCGQLDRATYVATNKALEAMGGKWNRKAQAHLFPTDPRPNVEGLLGDGSLTVEKDGYFVTPEPIGTQMAQLANLRIGLNVLEPSAGTGELVEAILETEPLCIIAAIEKNSQRAEVLDKKGYNLIGHDFFEHQGTWDRIIQNPPFEEFQDIAHVRHAYDCLAPGGRLVSVMSEGTFFRNGPAAKFRDWLDEAGGWDVDLPADAFKSSGTGVKTRLVVIDKPVYAEAEPGPEPRPVYVATEPDGVQVQLPLPMFEGVG